MRPAKLDWVRNEITRMRGQLSAQEREIRMLRRAGMSTASAELLLSRMRAMTISAASGRRCARRAGCSGRIPLFHLSCVSTAPDHITGRATTSAASAAGSDQAHSPIVEIAIAAMMHPNRKPNRR